MWKIRTKADRRTGGWQTAELSRDEHDLFSPVWSGVWSQQSVRVSGQISLHSPPFHLLHLPSTSSPLSQHKSKSLPHVKAFVLQGEQLLMFQWALQQVEVSYLCTVVSAITASVGLSISHIPRFLPLFGINNLNLWWNRRLRDGVSWCFQLQFYRSLDLSFMSCWFFSTT